MIAVWWILASLPLLKNIKSKVLCPVQDRVIYHTFKRLFEFLKNIKNEKHIFMFLLAFFFYIDGVYTIIEMATAYGKVLGFDSTQLLGALLLTQIVAFPAAIIFGRLSDKFNNSKLDYSLYYCLLFYHSFCNVNEQTDSFLDTGSLCRSVSGWCTVIVEILFCQDYSCRKIRRILAFLISAVKVLPSLVPR